MISYSNTDPTYYELPDVTYENQDINSADDDRGVYVIDQVRSKKPSEVQNQVSVNRKAGHKPSLQGVYDDLYDYNVRPQAAEDSAYQMVLNKDVHFKQNNKYAIVGAIGGFFLGAVVVLAIFIIQGSLLFAYSN